MTHDEAQEKAWEIVQECNPNPLDLSNRIAQALLDTNKEAENAALKRDMNTVSLDLQEAWRREARLQVIAHAAQHILDKGMVMISDDTDRDALRALQAALAKEQPKKEPTRGGYAGSEQE